MKEILLILLFTGSIAYCQDIDYKKLTTSELVGILSSDSLGGRYIGDASFERAAKFTEDYLRSIEVRPFFNGSYRDSLTVLNYRSFNIVGVIESEKSEDEYILIGAHLDHLGKVKSQTDSVFNGANDNASGVTAVLQIARELKKYSFNKKVIVALFTGEENGLKGSRHLAQSLKESNIKLSYMINFEMIGTPLSSAQGKVYITGFTRSDFGEVANEILKEEFILYKGQEFSDRLFGASDNYPFYLEYRIPSHTLSTFDFKNYKYFHSAEDESSQLDIQHMDYIIQKSGKLIIGLLQKESQIQLKK